jgi:hypothetical protein
LIPSIPVNVHSSNKASDVNAAEAIAKPFQLLLLYFHRIQNICSSAYSFVIHLISAIPPALYMISESIISSCIAVLPSLLTQPSHTVKSCKAYEVQIAAE